MEKYGNLWNGVKCKWANVSDSIKMQRFDEKWLSKLRLSERRRVEEEEGDGR